MKLEFSDYDGPTGLYIATNSKIVPLVSEEGAKAMIESMRNWLNYRESPKIRHKS